MGLSVFLPKAPTESHDTLRATVRFANDIREEQPAGEGKKRRVGLTITYNRLTASAARPSARWPTSSATISTTATRAPRCAPRRPPPRRAARSC
jgi:hypothetical protein